MDPVAQRPGFFRRVLNTGAAVVNTGVAVLTPAPVLVVGQGAAKVADKVLTTAGNMAAPVLANPLVKKATGDLAALLASPAQQLMAWQQGFNTLGANLIQAWGVNSQKHDWDKLSKEAPGPTFPSGIDTPQILREQLNPAKREAVSKVLDAFPGLGAGADKLAQLKVLADRLSPEQLAKLATRLQGFKEGSAPSKPFQEEVVGELIQDLANPLRANNACGPTCSSTSSQMRMARDKPDEYADIVLDMAQGKDHRLPGGGTVKAAYGEDTVKKLREGGNPASASALLFQTNLQHFAASHVSMGKPVQNVFNPLFNGGLNKLFQSLDQAQLGQDIDNAFVNKDLDKFNPLDGNRQTGHDPAQMEFLNQQLFPGAKARSWLTDSPNDMWAAVESDLKQGKSVSVSVFNPTPKNPADRFHVVTVLGVDPKTSPPTVHFHTWGGERTLSLDDFKKSCVMAMPGGK